MVNRWCAVWLEKVYCTQYTVIHRLLFGAFWEHPSESAPLLLVRGLQVLELIVSNSDGCDRCEEVLAVISRRIDDHMYNDYFTIMNLCLNTC